MAVQATSDRKEKAKSVEGNSLKLRFDENDDLVLDDIPDGLLADVSALAVRRGVSSEEMWRELLIKLAENWRER